MSLVLNRIISLVCITTTLIAVFTLAGCSTGRLIDLKLTLNYKLLESVFLYQFKNNGSSLKESADAYCLHVHGHKLDVKIFKHFENHSPKVLSSDKCGGIDRRLVFSIQEIRQISDSKYYVFGGYTEEQLSNLGNRYTLRKDSSGLWRVVNHKILWVN